MGWPGVTWAKTGVNESAARAGCAEARHPPLGDVKVNHPLGRDVNPRTALTPDEFRSSRPEPSGLSPALSALWRDAQGDWDGAHERAQADEGGAGDWVHAYLHRKEGDEGNAAYWYRRARRPFPGTSLDEEWADIVSTLLKDAR